MRTFLVLGVFVIPIFALAQGIGTPINPGNIPSPEAIEQCLKDSGVAGVATPEQFQSCFSSFGGANFAPGGDVNDNAPVTAPKHIATPNGLSGASSCPNLTRTLSRGAKGNDVTQLQDFLISQGDLAGGNNTGFFGALTEAAVKKFQCRSNVVCSGTPVSTGYGTVGAKTRAAIMRSCSNTTTSTNSYSQGSYGTNYFQGIYYSQGSYADPLYTQASYYSQGSYTTNTTNTYSQASYYSQGSYTPTSNKIQLVSNAQTVNGVTRPAYSTPAGLVSYVLNGASITAYQGNTELWSTTGPGGATISGLSGGLDVQQDNYPEIIVTETALGPNDTCAGTSVDQSQVSILNGKTGALMYGAKLPNCGTSTGTTFPVKQFYVGSVLFGSGSSAYVARQYETQGWALQFSSNSAQTLGTSIFPVSGGHAANGLIAGNKLIFFTSGLVAQYAMQKTTDSILTKVSSAVHASHQSATDSYDDGGAAQCFDGCRNYGLVARAVVGGVEKVILISGAVADTLAQDSRSGTRGNDIHGGIARHFDIYDTGSGAVQYSRYYSYSHDPSNTDAHQYGGRVTFPAHALLQTGGATYVFFNVYNEVTGRSDTTIDDRWYVSLNQIGAKGNVSEVKIYNYYLWDIVRSTNGAYYYVVSKTNGYWPEKKTSLASFNGTTFTPIETFNGIPVSATTFRMPDLSSSSGYLTPVLVNNGSLVLQ